LWTYRDLHAFVDMRGGLLALAHPFRFSGRLGVDVERFPPHALELYSHNTRRRAEPIIRAVAAALDLPLLSNSDAHRARDVGAYYNELYDAPQDDRGLVALLKARAYTPVAPPD
jgi:hypothetical protein